MSRLVDRVKTGLRAQQEAYAVHADDERPLGGYLVAITGFTVLTTGVGLLTAAKGTQRLSVRDVVLLGAATHKLARIVSKDAVASPVRAPFTSYKGPAGPGEVMEEVRGHGVRHAVGELLTCPFCLSPWVATLLLGGIVVAPKITHNVMTVFSAVTVADGLQFAYSALEKTAD